ncbi:MAG: DNA methyltransferase [Bacteroidales bacterium]|nr:DNA methyltransferase [Bacteroidales bacterium]MDZ4204252.1 DNA methyltransferase [Bacteroidales bacterium]
MEKLKQLFPEAITEGKVDWEKLQATLGKENIEFKNERYVLNWAGKTDAFKILQQSTTATLKPVPEESYLTPGPSPNGEGSEVSAMEEFLSSDCGNVFIEGENLEVLKVLQKAYYGKIKCIIIDPPYNTGNDSFIYPDSFKESKEEYQKRIGEKDEEGYLLKEGFFRKNSKDSGHYHSNWLSMMYPRLFLAKNLLREDGVIFVHIDDNEVHNLRLMMNEIFGEENFFAQVIVRSNSRGQTYKQIAKTHEYILVYTTNFETDLNELGKDENNNDLNLNDDIGNYNIRELRNRNPKFGKHNRPNLFYPIYANPKVSDKDGFSPVSLVKNENYNAEILPLNSEKKESCWRWGQKKCISNINLNTIESNLVAKKKGDGSYGVYEKYRKTTYKPKSIWDDNSFLTETGTVELRELGFENIFDFPKPVALEKQILNLSIEDDDIVLDFFAGSGTTAQSVLELNREDGGSRKFILVQLPEKCDEESEAYKAGYKTIADIAKERIRRVIKNLTPNPSPIGEGNSIESLFKGATPTLFENAHQLRLMDKTEAEEILWQALRNRKIENCKFRRQHPIGQFIADFYCHEKKLVIEVDGGYHNKQEQKEYDEARTQVINEYGITVIRFTNDEVLNNIQTVLNKIRQALKTAALENSPLSNWRGAGGEVGFKVFKLSSSNFKIWRGSEITEDNLETQLDAFTNPVREGSEKENILYELMLKAGYLLTAPLSIWRGAGGEVYSVNDGELIIALEEINKELIATIISAKPKKVITLDKLFAGYDQLKTNTVLQMRDADIDFKTI